MFDCTINSDLLDPDIMEMMQRGKSLPRHTIHFIPEQEYQQIGSMKQELDQSRADYVELADRMDRQAHAAEVGRVKSAVGCGIIAAALIIGVAADVVNAVFGCAVAGVCCLLEVWCWRGCKDV